MYGSTGTIEPTGKTSEPAEKMNETTKVFSIFRTGHFAPLSFFKRGAGGEFLLQSQLKIKTCARLFGSGCMEFLKKPVKCILRWFDV